MTHKEQQAYDSKFMEHCMMEFALEERIKQIRDARRYWKLGQRQPMQRHGMDGDKPITDDPRVFHPELDVEGGDNPLRKAGREKLMRWWAEMAFQCLSIHEGENGFYCPGIGGPYKTYEEAAKATLDAYMKETTKEEG